MGTLLNQPARDSLDKSDSISTAIEYLKRAAKDCGVSLDQAIAVAAIVEKRRTNDLYHANGDIHDEQMSGIGELICELIESINSVSVR